MLSSGEVTGCDASQEFQRQLWNVTWYMCCCYSKQHPCSEMWRSWAGRRAYVGEKIQPLGLDIPGENNLSGPYMTCCHSNKLEGYMERRPPEHWAMTLCMIWEDANKVFSINYRLSLIIWGEDWRNQESNVQLVIWDLLTLLTTIIFISDKHSYSICSLVISIWSTEQKTSLLLERKKLKINVIPSTEYVLETAPCCIISANCQPCTSLQ